MAVQAGLVLLIIFALLLILRVPISISIAIASIATILTQLPFDLSIL